MGRLDDLDLSKSLSRDQESKRLARVQPQLRLPLGGIGAVTGEAAIREQAADVAGEARRGIRWRWRSRLPLTRGDERSDDARGEQQARQHRAAPRG